MSEQRTGVEALDLDLVVSTLSDYLALTYQVLQNERYLAMALSQHPTLRKGTPPDVDAVTRQGLEDAHVFTSDTLTWLREEHGIRVSVFDPEKNAWYPILGVGVNWESFCMVASVFDPQDPYSDVTKWLGPTPALACSPLEITGSVAPQPPGPPTPLELTDHLQRPFTLLGQAVQTILPQSTTP